VRFLTLLDISDNHSIIDFSPLKEAGNLSQLFIRGTKINDLSIFYEMPLLYVLDLSGCVYYDPEQLKGLKYTTTLNVMKHTEAHKYLPDISFESLAIESRDFDSFSYIASAKQSLRDLHLNGVGLPDLSGIEKFSKLEKLNLENTEINDLSPLLTLPNLKWLQVSGDMREAAETIEDLAGFEIVIR
jgi:Leucine-rich repeat (LRR) protein